jgi:hypothetical protein
VNNRFVRRIRSGEIDCVEDLKAEFKALAKLTHPDLRGPGAAGDDFAAVRGEYEAALRDFVSHRYGGPASEAGPPPAFDRRALYVDLARLFKRGFPKAPRHEKERIRYEYCRYLARSRFRAWDESYPALLDAFEEEMLMLRDRDPRVYDEALDVVAGVLEYHATGIAYARAAVRLDLAHFRAPADWQRRGLAKGPGVAPSERDALTGFLSLLVGDMGTGPALV